MIPRSPDQTPRLHVILIAPLFPPMPGGGSTHPFYLTRALGSLRGIRVHVIAPEPQLPKGDKHWVHPRRVNIHRVKVKYDPGKVPFAPFLGEALRIYARIRSSDGFLEHERIVVHGQHWAGVFVAMHFRNRFNIPVFATLHKTPIGDALGDITKDTDPSYCHLTWLVEWPISTFVAGSRFFEAELRKHAPDTRVEMIHHGVSARWLRDRASRSAQRAIRDKLGLRPDDELILCPVRWDPRKRVPDFVAAAGRVVSELPARNLRFLITAGITDDDDRDELDRIVAEAGIANHLLVKELAFEDVPAVFSTSSLVAVPTDREGLGMSVIEAMALGRPVVATAAEGIREIIAHERDGCLYAAGEVDQLAQIIVKLLREPDYAGSLADQGRKTAAARFSDAAMATAYVRMYRSALASDNKKTGREPLGPP